MTQSNRDNFIYLAGRCGQTVKFYNIEELCKDKISEFLRLMPGAMRSIFSVGAMYRLLTPQLLSQDIEKIIYLDSDIIVNLDIKELWQIELGNKILAAVPEISNGVDIQKFAALCHEGYVDKKDFFNSGVLLMNLNIFRTEEKNIVNGVRFIGQHPQFLTVDQEVLNYLFAKDYLKLPVEFNYFVKSHRHSEKSLSKKIYHYTATIMGNGVTLDINDPFNRLWMDHFIKSPWFDSSTIGRLYETARTESQTIVINLSAGMNGKTRTFILLEKFFNAVVKTFSVGKNDEILIVKEETPIQKIIDVMKESRNEKFFFIMLPDFPIPVLIQAGFFPNRDFVNGLEFLSGTQGVPPNPYKFINAM